MGWDNRSNREKPAQWKQKRLAVWKRDGRQCVVCRRSLRLSDMRADHIVPFWKLGGDELGNLQSLCLTCHNEKSAREHRERLNNGAKPERVYDWSRLSE